MRKIFIDCGSNIGQSVSHFKTMSLYSPDFIIYCFEPLPCFDEMYKNRKDIIFSNKAVWINNGEINFYISKKMGGIGSTLKKEKRSFHPDSKNPIRVECFDFSKWIINNFSKEDYIILKMDIEGAEYDVLEKMVNDGSIYYIKKAFVEFHARKMTPPDKRHDPLVKILKNICSFELLPELKKFS